MKRINIILKHQLFKECLALNNNREQNRHFCCHDLQHLIDVARLCYILVLEKESWSRILPGAGSEQIKEVVYAAGLTHDMGRWYQYDTGEDHAVTGAGLSRRVLEDAGFSKLEITLIVDAVLCHRSGSTGGGVLGEYLRRADDLSRACWRCEVRNECKKLDQMESANALIY